MSPTIHTGLPGTGHYWRIFQMLAGSDSDSGLRRSTGQTASCQLGVDIGHGRQTGIADEAG